MVVLLKDQVPAKGIKPLAVQLTQVLPAAVQTVVQAQVVQTKPVQAAQINPWLMKCWQLLTQHVHRLVTVEEHGWLQQDH
ncbi:hypothetical protein PSSHI_42130 [Photobacterium sp. R1]